MAKPKWVEIGISLPSGLTTVYLQGPELGEKNVVSVLYRVNAINLNETLSRVSLNKQHCHIVNGLPRKKMPERSNKNGKAHYIVRCE